MRTRVVVSQLVVGAVASALLFGVTARPAHALAHGCASFTRDMRVQFDARAHALGVATFVDAPCSFVYAEGDTYSGSGRFSVACAGGGRVDHPDFQDGQYPPVANIPIPQPCTVGDRVVIDGYRAGTGGGVVAGGLCGATPAATAACGRAAVVPQGTRQVTEDPDGFRALCAPNEASRAIVALRAPVNYSGLLTYVGRVRCIGANVRITSLTARPWPGYAARAAHSAACDRCTDELRLADTTPAETGVFEVVMRFDVSDGRRQVVHGQRIARYAASWAGVPVRLCPVGTQETCPE